MPCVDEIFVRNSQTDLNEYLANLDILSHSGYVTSYGDIDLDQH